jgi:hypothetical protein
MTKDIYRLADRLQRELLAIAADRSPEDWAAHGPRVLLDAWASLVRWSACDEPRWRISAAVADEIGDMLLPPDLPLSTARVRAEAVAYQLPDRGAWIVLARHAPAPCAVIVHGDVRWAYAQPVLTYCTVLEDGALASGYLSLADMPTAGALHLRPGLTLALSGPRALNAAEVSEEDYRVSLALLHHYLP